MAYRLTITGDTQLLARMAKLADPVRMRRITSTALRNGQKIVMPAIKAVAPVRQTPYTSKSQQSGFRQRARQRVSRRGNLLKRRPGSLRDALRIRASAYDRGARAGRVSILTNLRRTEFMQDFFYPAPLTYGTKDRHTKSGKYTGKIKTANNFELKGFNAVETQVSTTVMAEISNGLTRNGA